MLYTGKEIKILIISTDTKLIFTSPLLCFLIWGTGDTNLRKLCRQFLILCLERLWVCTHLDSLNFGSSTSDQREWTSYGRLNHRLQMSFVSMKGPPSCFPLRINTWPPWGRVVTHGKDEQKQRWRKERRLDNSSNFFRFLTPYVMLVHRIFQ